jgi:hypothetical protein
MSIARSHRQTKSKYLSVLGAALVIFALLFLAGCGGGSSSSNNVSTSTAPAITSVSVSCTANTVPVGQTNQCSATVKGTGSFNSAVNWSVGNVQGGNTTVGTVASNGLYTAPGAVPTPYTVTVTATSAGDATKSASASVIVAGTIASVSQTITAAAGGTITLPDGSSVTIAPGVLPSDQTLTLSELSYINTQPPNAAIGTFGPSLALSFSTPVELSRSARKLVEIGSRERESRYNNITSSPQAIQFSVNAAANNVPLLQASVPLGEFVDSSGNVIFSGLDGNYDSTTAIVTANVGADLLSGIENKIQQIVASASNFIDLVAKLGINTYLAPNQLSLDTSNVVQWTTRTSCPTGKTVVMVHGFFSDVENAFDTQSGTIQTIKKNSDYASVLGFDYDWTQDINTSGKELAGFLDNLTNCPSENKISLDIEAHSEGVAVSLSAITQLKKAQIQRLIALGGPIMGTPLANGQGMLLAVLAVLSKPIGLDLPGDIIDNGSIKGLQDLVNAPFRDELKPSATGSGDTLDKIRTLVGSQTAMPQIIVAAGNLPRLVVGSKTIPMSWAKFLMGTNNFDGFIPVTSALALQSRSSGVQSSPILKVYPLSPFPIGHTELEQATAATVGAQVTDTASPPILEISSTPMDCAATLYCTGLAGTIFFLGGPNSTGYTSGASVSVYKLMSTGDVTLFDRATSDGTLPQAQDLTDCSTAAETNEYFAVEAGTNHSSNAVTEYIVGPSAGTIPITPATAMVGLERQQQFVANLPSCMSLGVQWDVNGVAGGDSTVGTIDAGGLFTAPASVPHPATVTVTATSQASPSASGSATVTVVNGPPVLNLVNPTSIIVGPFTLTVMGTGFLSGAHVNFGTTALTTTFVSSTKLTATGTATAAQAGTVPVTVVNPGPSTSNAVNVTVVSVSGGSSGSTGIIVGTVNGQTVDEAYVPLPNFSLVSVVNVDAVSGTNPVVTTIPMPNFYSPNATAADQGTLQIVVISYTSPDVQIIDAAKNQLLATLTSPVTSSASFSGGSCMICGVTIDPTTNTAILDTAQGYLLLNLAQRSFSSFLAGTVAGENFGYDPNSLIVLNPTYGQSIGAGLQAINLANNSVFLYSTFTGNVPESGAIDINTNIAVVPDEFTGDQYLINMAQVAFDSAASPPAFSAPSTIFTVNYTDCGGEQFDWSLVSTESSSHLLFMGTEFADCAAVEPLPTSVLSGAPPTPSVFQWGHMPLSPDGVLWENSGDPHGIAAFTSVVNGKSYGFLVRIDQAWVARVDLMGVATAPQIVGGIQGEVDLTPFVTFYQTQ